VETLLIIYSAGIAGSVLLGALIVLRIVGDGGYLASIGLPPAHVARMCVIIKVLGIASAAVGALSAKFYGCGYTYEHLLDDPVAITWEVLDQFEGMFRYLLIFLLVLVTLHLGITLFARRRRIDSPSS
jgi:hypothetical protein